MVNVVGLLVMVQILNNANYLMDVQVFMVVLKRNVSIIHKIVHQMV